MQYASLAVNIETKTLVQPPVGNLVAKDRERTLTEHILQHQEKIKNFIRRTVQQECDVEDILQKMLLSSLSCSKSEQLKSPLSYAYKMAVNLMWQHFKAVQELPDSLPDEMECDCACVELSFECQRVISRINRELLSMPVLRRRCFTMTQFAGCSLFEVAGQLGITEQAAKKHITRAKKQLLKSAESDVNCKW